MPKPRQQLRIALIQVRDNLEAAAQELRCFAERCRVELTQIRALNLCQDPDIRWPDVADADAVMLGGAGAHTVTRDYPFTAPLGEVMERLIDDSRPIFASCWGHQFMAQVMGGTVITDLDNKEVGTFEVELTEAGRRDPLLAEHPRRFTVQLGHNDRIDREPHGLEVLAGTGRCRHQLVRVAGKPIYSSQFHSEMNDDDMRRRLAIYRDSYLHDEDAIAVFERSLKPSPLADRLLDRFLTLYV